MNGGPAYGTSPKNTLRYDMDISIALLINHYRYRKPPDATQQGTWTPRPQGGSLKYSAEIPLQSCRIHTISPNDNFKSQSSYKLIQMSVRLEWHL
jgi:hypothetical protein